MALRYLDAVVEHDWEAACETRSPDERKEFARMAGSCERMYKVLFEDKPTDLFDGSEAGEVRIEGDVAGVDIHQIGQRSPPRRWPSCAPTAAGTSRTCPTPRRPRCSS